MQPSEVIQILRRGIETAIFPSDFPEVRKQTLSLVNQLGVDLDDVSYEPSEETIAMSNDLATATDEFLNPPIDEAEETTEDEGDEEEVEVEVEEDEDEDEDDDDDDLDEDEDDEDEDEDDDDLDDEDDEDDDDLLDDDFDDDDLEEDDDDLYDGEPDED